MQTKKIYYIGIKEDCPEREQKRRLFFQKKPEAAVCRQEEALPFAGGFVELYTGLIFCPDKKKQKKQKNRLLETLRKTMEEAEGAFSYGEIILGAGLCERIGKKEEALPLELYAAFLKKQQLIQKITISLGEDAGQLYAERVIELLEPYLSRLNHVVYLGERESAAEQLEDYLYEEYGILMSYAKRPEKAAAWLDFSDKTEPLLEKYASEHKICHINRAGILKFLDTMAKNRYNTGVN